MSGRYLSPGIAVALLVVIAAVPRAVSATASEAQMMEAVRAAAVANTRAAQAARQMENENAALENLINSPQATDGTGHSADNGLSAAQSANQAGQRCIAVQQRLDGELERANAVLLPNENIERLATLRTYSLRLRDAWLPCNEARANMYAKVAADALRTCESVASDPAPCGGIEAMNASRQQRENAAALQQLGKTINDVIQQRQDRRAIGVQGTSRGNGNSTGGASLR